MCMGCWEDAGRPWKVTDAVRRTAPLFAAANEFGALHIVVSDWNLEDDNIAFCRGEDPTPEEVTLLDALSAMDDDERYTTAVLAWNPDFDPAQYVP